MKKTQFEEIISGIGLIALLLSYQIFGFSPPTVLIGLKFILDTYFAISLAIKSVNRKKNAK